MSSSVTWEVNFTRQFEQEAKKLQESGVHAWLDKLSFLKDGPNVKSNHLKALKNQSRAFRWRCGDLRVIFRLIAQTQSILLLRVGHRKSVYNKKLSSKQDAVGRLSDFLNSSKSKFKKAETRKNKQQDFADITFELTDDDSSIEELFVDEADLYLLQVPEEYRELLLDAKSLKDPAVQNLPRDILERLEDYITSPAMHHVGRAYTLARSDSFASIAEQGLDQFLVALDPQQKSIVDRPLSGGPWLVRGGPGTGKTLINLARMQRILEEQAGKDLLNEQAARIGFVTYNSSLSNSAGRTFEELSGKIEHGTTKFTTFDSIVNGLLSKLEGRPRSIIYGRQEERLFESALRDFNDESYEQTYVDEVLQRRNSTFLLEEINQTILGCDLHEKEDYLAYPRKGRKMALQAKERGLIHSIYRRWLAVLRINNRTTFEARRLAVLKQLENGGIDLEGSQYDFLFVDELQDLSIVAIRILIHLIHHPENLSFTADTAQSIYLKSPSWSTVSPKIRFHAGNSYVLRKSYRMTREIDAALRPLRLNAGEAEQDNDGISEPIFGGAKPSWVDIPIDEHPKMAAKLVQTLHNDQGLNLGQVAVVTPDKKTSTEVGKQLRTLDMQVDMVGDGKVVNLKSSQVHVLHSHIAKGLEFPFVIVIGVMDGNYPNQYAMANCIDDETQQEELDRARRLLYVALSRAARGLWMVTDSRASSPLLASLDVSDWDIVQGTLNG